MLRFHFVVVFIYLYSTFRSDLIVTVAVVEFIRYWKTRNARIGLMRHFQSHSASILSFTRTSDQKKMVDSIKSVGSLAAWPGRDWPM